MLNLLDSIAEFEREVMLERQREGIAKAKAEGKFKGRKAHRPRQVSRGDLAGKSRAEQGQDREAGRDRRGQRLSDSSGGGIGKARRSGRKADPPKVWNCQTGWTVSRCGASIISVEGYWGRRAR
jgi:hypothetical protein